MPDGSWGYTAEEGLKAVLGGVNIDEMNRKEGAMSPEEMRRYIESAPSTKNISYSDESRRFAKRLLKAADEDSDSYLRFSEVDGDLKFLGIDADEYDLTGFMYGWAINAVRYTLSAKPVANPAIITI